MTPEQMAALYDEMLRRQRLEEQAMAEQGAYSGQPGAPVPAAPVGHLPTPQGSPNDPGNVPWDLPLAGSASATTPAPRAPEPPRRPISPWDDLIRQHAGDLAEDPRFIRTVAAGARAESGDDPRKYQIGYDPNDPRTHTAYGGRGLWQFDINPGAKGHGIPEEQLFDPAYQASVIVPEYADVYRKVTRNIDRGVQRPMSDAELASLVAGEAERPYQWQIPSSPARRNYVRAYGELMGG